MRILEAEVGAKKIPAIALTAYVGEMNQQQSEQDFNSTL
jgi:hypothetical protein